LRADVCETEDYYFIPDKSFSICEDINGDGVINLEDLAAFTTDWLENCPYNFVEYLICTNKGCE